MKYLALMLILLARLSAHAQENLPGIDSTAKSSLFQKAAKFYSDGKYQAAADELNELFKRLEQSPSTSKAQLGFLAYWQALSLNRLQDYSEAIAKFDKALQLDYVPQDIHYEYGQALFAMEKLAEARLQFKESLKKKFKRGVSLYYIAYISKEMGDKKRAFTFYKAINKLSAEEAKEVKQAAEFQIGDIYLDQVEKHPDAFRAVETYVLPQYEKAIAADPTSKLAFQIKEKVTILQKKYDLVLFRMRNGRPTLIPPYFLRAAAELGVDSNVTFSPTETTVSKAKQGSPYSRNDFIGRYTFYYKNIFSVSPELRFNYTRYYNRVPEIYRNDNYLIAPAVRGAYEHRLWEKPASILVDYEYADSQRDVEAKKKLEFSSRSNTFMIGERFNYFKAGESVVRLRHRLFDSYLDGNDSKTTSLVFEQLKIYTLNILVFYFSYDRMRSNNNVFDTDSLTLRTDLILSQFREGWFVPTFGLALTSVDPVNDRANRGRELMINPSVRLSRIIGKNWRANLKGDYQQNQSKDENAFAYKKTTYAFELEYLF